MTELPNYFLADLPPEATLSATMLTEACQTLKRNRAQYLASRTTEDLVRLLSRVGDNWLDSEYPFRKLALREGPARTGFGRATIERGLDRFFRQLTRENLMALLAQELGDARRLDQFTALPGESRAALTTGPELLAHIAAGNVPNPTWMSLVLGLLTRSAQFVKCSHGASYLPRLFAHSLYEQDHKLGACMEVAEWRGGHVALENAVFAEANLVTATGSDETLAAVRARLPVTTRFVGYGHRLSFGFIAASALFGRNGKRLAAAAADDVTAWNQLGCLSPHVFYVQSGGEIVPEMFAELLAEELERRETTDPRGDVPNETAAGIASRRAIYEVRVAHSPDTKLWRSSGSTAWTVVFEADTRLAVSCLHRFVYVKATADLAEALRGADDARGQVSTVGLAGGEMSSELATQLARWGATRICPIGQMQAPPLAWRHDGRPCLGDLVLWTDLEGNQL
jgi:hypothetical protein